MSAETSRCSETCAHGRQCSRASVPYGDGRCEQHRQQVKRQVQEERDRIDRADARYLGWEWP